MIVGRHGEEDPTCAQVSVLRTTVDTEPGPVEMDSVDVVTKLCDVLTCVVVRVGTTTQEAIDLVRSVYPDFSFVALEQMARSTSQRSRRGSDKTKREQTRDGTSVLQRQET